MTTSGDEKKLRFIINCVYLALIAAIVYIAVKYLLFVLLPFVFGFALAAAAQPIARFCHKKNGANIKACSVAVVLLLVAVLTLLTVSGISKLVLEMHNASKQLPETISNLTRSLGRLSLWLSPFFNSIQSFTGIKFDTSLSGFTNQLLKISQLPQAVQKFFQSAVSALPAFLLDIVATVVAACFIAADYKHITIFLLRCLPHKYRKTVREIKSFFMTTVLQLIRAYLTLMLITFCELLAGFLILGIKTPVAAAAIIAVVDILPVLGTGTVLIPWALIELLMGKFSLGIGILLTYAIITVVRNILEPKIVGHHIGLHPLVTLTAIVIGLKLLGFAGMVIFPVAIIILKHLHENGIIRFHD